jgi:hypothetical protein
VVYWPDSHTEEPAMPDREILVYLAAKRQEQLYREKFKELSGAVSAVAGDMDNRERTLKHPLHETRDTANPIVGDSAWPPAADLNQAWENLLTAVRAVDEAWKDISDAERFGLIPPERMT